MTDVGPIRFQGGRSRPSRARRLTSLRREMQKMIVQDKYSSLKTPRKKVGHDQSPTSRHPHDEEGRDEGGAKAGGPGAEGPCRPQPEHYNRYKHELIGRPGISAFCVVARALALQTQGDVAGQRSRPGRLDPGAETLKLLREPMQRELGLRPIFIAARTSVVAAHVRSSRRHCTRATCRMEIEESSCTRIRACVHRRLM